ncbi:hypothetical protein NMY22_g18372 [Coprinellus aureogranulatus]|nr:hypothetical protein NMY22_g18372 [Coprinellus aureogranulatus]
MVGSIATKAAEANSTAKDAAELAATHEASANEALKRAEEAIKKIPTQERLTFIATLAPDFAHLAGPEEPGNSEHPPKPSFSGVPADLVGFSCTGCKAYNLVRSGKKPWYAIFAGKKTGIYYGSHRAHPLVVGVKGSSYMGFYTLEEAEAAFAAALLADTVHEV